MPPDGNKIRQETSTTYVSGKDLRNDVEENNGSKFMSDVVKQVLMDFPCIEQPIRCFLSCMGNDKQLSCSQKGIAFAREERSEHEEFKLIPEGSDHNVFTLKNTKLDRLICSDAKGTVYAAQTRLGDMEKWTLVASPKIDGGYFLISACSRRYLQCNGNRIHTEDPSNIEEYDDAQQLNITWKVDLNSGELCYLSASHVDMRLRCDLTGKLSMSNNYKGWEGWRLVEAGGGYIRISPWAHSHKYLCSNETGEVSTTERREDPAVKWYVEKAPLGFSGVLIRSAVHNRVLLFDETTNTLSTGIDSFETPEEFLVVENAVWQLPSLHRQTYYVTSSIYKRRIGTGRNGNVSMSNVPIRKKAEQWRLEGTGESGVVRLFSESSQMYMGSLESGKVCLMSSMRDDGSDKWVISESLEGSQLLRSITHNRYLACSDGSTLCTVTEDDISCSAKLWSLEPCLPRQVTKDKLKAVGTAFTVGVATTIVCPVLITGAVGVMGIAEAGVAARVVTGSIRAAETLSSITRVAVSSSNFFRSASSILSDDSRAENDTNNSIANRPFCGWNSW